MERKNERPWLGSLLILQSTDHGLFPMGDFGVQQQTFLRNTPVLPASFSSSQDPLFPLILYKILPPPSCHLICRHNPDQQPKPHKLREACRATVGICLAETLINIPQKIASCSFTRSYYKQGTPYCASGVPYSVIRQHSAGNRGALALGN